MEKRTYKDRSAYLIKAVAKRRRKIKEMAIVYKGGKCCICDYNKSKSSLDFHHKNGEVKNFGLSVRGLTRSWTRTKTELDKCALVCANCHREIHEGITQLPREIGVEKSWDNGKG